MRQAAGTAWFSCPARAPHPFLTRDRPDIDRIFLAADLEHRGAVPGLADAHRDLLRGEVVRVDAGDQAVDRLGQESVAQRSLCRFGRIALPPILLAERPADLEPRPALRIDHADAAHHGAVGFALDRPFAITANCPMAGKAGERAPSVVALHDAAK